MSKLKTNKFFIKKNQKNKDFPLIWKTNILSLFIYLSKEKNPYPYYFNNILLKIPNSMY